MAANALTFPHNKVAVVTGSGRGIGECIAHTLAAHTHSVAVVDLDESNAQRVAADIRGKGFNAQPYSVDVSDNSQVVNVCARIIKDLGGVDILVNNAGITRDNLFMRMSTQEWLDVININLNSCFYFTKAVIRHMTKHRYGRIVNMASVVGVGGNAGQANYAAAKSGIIGFTKSVAKELANRGITCNAIAPGFIQTAMTDKLSDEQKSALLTQVPANRMGNPQEVADLTLFLSSDQASYINGHVIPIDGAMLFGYP